MKHFTFRLVKQNEPVPLAMGEVSSASQFGCNSRYLEKNGKPWLPVMAEFHPTRYDDAEWELELRKMKAAGVDIVATYLFWIFHEEEEGNFCFDGNRDISHFLKLCRKIGLYVFVRIGPWCHGECRNGGFPDWLQNSGILLRSNDERYLFYVRRLFAAYAREISPCLFRNGGPVIGIQLENELTENEPHLRELKRIALSCGLYTPYYTVTGWGAHVTEFPKGEVLPVFGAYPAGPWEQHTDPLPVNKNYFFSPCRNDSAIGSDLISGESGAGEEILQGLPFLTCELGPGNQVTYHRRPTISAMDALALATVSLGSGNCLPGYYMFHGGFNPVGGFYQESRDTGYPNDVPVSSYDFQAPLDEYGQPHESYFCLKRLHQFIHCCGERLAVMTGILPDCMPQSEMDMKTPRMILRGDEKGGYLFFNTHQRNRTMAPIEQLSVSIQYASLEERSYGPFDISAGNCGVFPIRQNWFGVTIEFMTMLPLWSGTYQDYPTLVCAVQTGVAPMLELQGCWTIRAEHAGSICHENGNICVRQIEAGKMDILDISSNEVSLRIMVLSEEDSLRFYPVEVEDVTHFFFCEGIVFEQSGRILCIEETEVPLDGGSVKLERDTNQHISADNPYVKYLFAEPEECPEYVLHIPQELSDNCYDAIFSFRVHADVIQLYAGDTLIADDFLRAEPWRISLRRMLPYLKAGQELRIKCSPITPERKVYLDTPVCAGDVDLRLINIRTIDIHNIYASFSSEKVE